MIRVVFSAVSLGALVTLLLSSASAAQQASPAASPSEFPVGACTVEPRPIEDFRSVAGTPGSMVSNLLGTPVATPSPPGGGTPVNPAVVDEIESTMVELIACINTGSLPRQASLFSNDFFRQFLGGIDEANIQVLYETPTPIPIDDQARLDAITDIQTLPDGQVSAVIRMNENRNLLIFVKADDGYLIDYSYELSDAATPTP